MDIQEIVWKYFSELMWLGKGQRRELFLNRAEFHSGAKVRTNFVLLRYTMQEVDISQFKES
jgi:hypothetical protein